MLIQQIMNRPKTATCSPKELYTDKELMDLLAMKGEYVTVMDKLEEPRCNIKIIDIFETTVGNPDLRLIEGESCSNGNNIETFKAQHKRAWGEEIEEGFELNDDTILIVEIFNLLTENC